MSWSWKAENNDTASWSYLLACASSAFESLRHLSEALNGAMTFGNGLQVGSCDLQQTFA